MNKFKLYNNIGAWLAFVIATIVFFMTLEPTASWWDCGEYIATAYKLQVGHPPGAPLFQLLGRFFSLFAFGNEAIVAMMVNAMSALSSSFTILFLFWTISMLAEKVMVKDGEMNSGKMYAILGSAFVGAMAFTFTDSFWFSAVEGEVYAMSSLFTAIVFWAILKWERVADKRHGYRWLLLIAYLIGLSIGVHLLNLLAIPAIAFVYYFKKYKITWKGAIVTALISFLILAVIMYIIVPWAVKLSSLFELFFVNSLGLPFNSGTIVYFVLLIGLIVWGLVYTARKRKVIANTVILAIVFILIGYSSFFMLIIRSNADTPIDENNPEDAIALLSYLNREQYGDWPVVYGQYYSAPIVDYEDGIPIYVKDKEKGKYVITDSRKRSIPVYDGMLFPRMWSNQKQGHKEMYKKYGKVKGKRVTVQRADGQTVSVTKPTFIENLRFFFNYQVGHMYFRYFMWNFAGRQNDIESQGEMEHGNWMTGIKFIDEWRLGNLDELPDHKDNPANNKFYLLPLILGLIGLFYQLGKSKKDTFIVFLLFLMTGLAIIIYLNQYPYQPRERDYAYAGSFYAFAIWIGLGVLGIYDFLQKQVRGKKLMAIAVTLVCLILVPGIMAKEGWDDHDRSGKYAARDFAFNYLEACDPEAVLFTNGDNDTFPLWYAQEVEGKRTDIRVVNYMLSSGAWYVHQLGRKIYESERLPLTLTPKQYNKGVNMYIPIIEQDYVKERFLNAFYKTNIDKFEDPYKGYIDKLISIMNDSDFPEKKESDYNQIISRAKQNKLAVETFNSLVNYFSAGKQIKEYNISKEGINKLKNDINDFKKELINSPLDLDFIIDFVASEDPQTKVPIRDNEQINFIPAKKVRLFVDSAACVDNGIVPVEMADKIVPYIEWNIRQNALYKNDLMLLDFVSSSDWTRSIYFANPSSVNGVFDVDEYCHMDGIVYKFMPVKAKHYVEQLGGVDTDESYDILVNKAQWGNLNDPDVSVDRESARNTAIIRQNYMRLSQALLDEGKKDSAVTVQDKYLHFFPLEKFPVDFYMMPYIEIYYQAGEDEKANMLVEELVDYCMDNIAYIGSLSSERARKFEEEKNRSLYYLRMLTDMTKQHKQKDLSNRIDSLFQQQMEFYEYE